MGHSKAEKTKTHKRIATVRSYPFEDRYRPTRFTTVTIDHRSGPGIWVDMTTYWSYRLSANESAIWRRILKHSG